MKYLAIWQVHDDARHKSSGTTDDIGYAAREMKPDWPLIRHNILHVMIEHPPKKRLVENPQLATAEWSNHKYGKQTRSDPGPDPGRTWTRYKPDS